MRLAIFLVLSLCTSSVFAATAGSTMTVGAEILPHVRASVTGEPFDLVITAEDVARGYMEVPAGQASVQTNDPLGFLVVARLAAGSPAAAGELRGFDETVAVAAGGGFANQPYRGTDRALRALRWRFVLSEDAVPGVYRWPLRVTVHPIRRR